MIMDIYSKSSMKKTSIYEWFNVFKMDPLPTLPTSQELHVRAWRQEKLTKLGSSCRVVEGLQYAT